jgi:hypothetical protein
MAALSGTYLAYCDCTRRGGGDKRTIVAAFTNGDSDNLMVGRHGVFYDRSGQDWDAVITRIIDQPISVLQAFWLPYKRVARMISEQVQKFAGDREKAVETASAKGVGAVSDKATSAAPAAPAAPFDIAKFAGIFAAAGLAVGAIGTALAAIVTGFLGLVWWQMPLALLGIILVISGPSMLIAYLKLRKRNLGPIIDANGWAVNTLARINLPFGASLTQVAALPTGAKRSKHDPFAQKGPALAAVPAAVDTNRRPGRLLAHGPARPLADADGSAPGRGNHGAQRPGEPGRRRRLGGRGWSRDLDRRRRCG